MMTREILLTFGDQLEAKANISKRDASSCSPGSVYVQLKEGDNYVYLEEDEVREILSAMESLR